MVGWTPIRRAIKVAPLALEVARQLDRQLRPHVLAYRSAREVDGYVARWTSQRATHWVVVPRPGARPLRAFPPLPADELAELAGHLDASMLRHHEQLPEARLRDSTARVVSGSVRAVGWLRGGGPRPG